jgi:hypothetical protein
MLLLVLLLLLCYCYCYCYCYVTVTVTVTVGRFFSYRTYQSFVAVVDAVMNVLAVYFLSNWQLSASQDGLSPVTWLGWCEISVNFLVLSSGFDRQYDTVRILQAGVVWLQDMQWRVKLRRHTQTRTHRNTQELRDHNCLSHHHWARMSCCWRVTIPASDNN